MTVTYEEYSRAKEVMLERIGNELDLRFYRISGIRASNIVDIDFEIGADGKVGIRIDNNFGVVNGEDAMKFTLALDFAANIAAEFQYLGYEVEGHDGE